MSVSVLFTCLLVARLAAPGSGTHSLACFWRSAQRINLSHIAQILHFVENVQLLQLEQLTSAACERSAPVKEAPACSKGSLSPWRGIPSIKK
jgi:hypothetical protein